MISKMSQAKVMKLLLVGLLVCLPLSCSFGQEKKADSQGSRSSGQTKETKGNTAEKKSAKKTLKGYRRVRAIVSRLESIQRGLLERGNGQSWLIEGHIRVIHYAKANWDTAKEFVEAYNRLIGQLVKEPIGSFLTHPGALVKVAQLIRWGQEVAIGYPNPIKRGFFEVKIVLAAPEEKGGKAQKADKAAMAKKVEKADKNGKADKAKK